MKIKAMIVDDHDANITVLTTQLGRLFRQVAIVATATDPQQGVQLALELQPDLLFLDIDMPGMNGFGFLEAVGTNLQVEVIFVTAFSEFALEAFESQAAGYITKPVNSEKLFVTVNNAIERIANRKALGLLGQQVAAGSDRKLALSTQKGLVFVDPEAIYYCESSGNYTTFFLKDNKQVLVSKQLGQFEQSLPPNRFVRIHDRYIINLAHLRSYNRGSGGSVVLENNKELPVSVRRKEGLLRHFTEYHP